MRIAAGVGGEVTGTSPVPVLVGALSPLMVQAAGELADGVVTWLAGPRSLGEAIVPRLHAAAAGRPAPRVVAALPVAVCAEEDLARRQADEVFARYGRFDNYRRQFEREGVASPGEVALVGTESDIERQLKSLADLGVTELWPVLFPAGPDPDVTTDRTRALLAGLSRPRSASRSPGSAGPDPPVDGDAAVRADQDRVEVELG